MSFFDDASLVFLPSGQAGKDGKAYSMKPTNGDGDFTFSRGSNLTATRVDSNGLIEKGRENLLLQSNSFNTTWTLGSGLSLTSGQSGYDGSSDAWEYSDTSTGNSLGQSVSTSGVQTLSVYAKTGTANGIRLRWLGGSGGNSYFNIADSSTEAYNTTNTIQTKKESIGGGWFRISIVFDSAVNTIRLYVADGSTTSSTSGSIYIQDAQLEQGLVATEYIESGASTGLAGILEDSPRFDYSGGASCPSLLLEPSRTNEIGYSEYFEGWTPQGSPTITSNYGTSPEGLQNSSRLKYTTDSDYIETSVSNTSGVFTIYAKGTGNLILTDSGANASSTTALTSSYQRIELYFSTNTTTLQIKTDSSGLDAEVYAAQFENDTYPTSYIPNHSGGSVTREADSFQNDTNTSPLNRNAEGTWFVELQKLGDDTNQALYLAPMTSNTQQIRLHFDASNARFRDARNGYATIGGGVNVKTSMTKMALSIDTTSGIAKVYANGSQLGSDYTLQSNPFEFSRIVAEGKGFILKESLFFPTALSDVELTALTS